MDRELAGESKGSLSRFVKCHMPPTWGRSRPADLEYSGLNVPAQSSSCAAGVGASVLLLVG